MPNSETAEKPRVQEVTSKKKQKPWHGTRKGFFNPNHPEKYDGNKTNIIYRSKLELRIMKFLDDHDDVLSWSSEEVKIPYVKPTDRRIHRYFVDFKATLKHKDGTVRTALLEAKWSTDLVAPKTPKRKTKRYRRQLYNWVVNQAKWDAAKKYCKEKDWDWGWITEKTVL
jgi:hypothetical protein